MSLYSEAIKNRDIQQLSDIFQSELDKFIRTEAELYLKCRRTHEFAIEEKKHICYEYLSEWQKFIYSTPFNLHLKYKGSEGSLSMSDITNHHLIHGYDSSLFRNIVEQIIRYSAYIISMECGQLFREQLIWQTLSLINKVIDVSNMGIHPEDVVKEVDKVIKEIGDGHFEKPQATLFMGRFYPYRLSRGEKTRLYRVNVVDGWIKDLILLYRSQYHRNPTIAETKEYIQKCSLTCNDKRLKVFADGINPKTFRFYVREYRLARSRRTNKDHTFT